MINIKVLEELKKIYDFVYNITELDNKVELRLATHPLGSGTSYVEFMRTYPAENFELTYDLLMNQYYDLLDEIDNGDSVLINRRVDATLDRIQSIYVNEFSIRQEVYTDGVREITIRLDRHIAESCKIDDMYRQYTEPKPTLHDSINCIESARFNAVSLISEFIERKSSYVSEASSDNDIHEVSTPAADKLSRDEWEALEYILYGEIRDDFWTRCRAGRHWYSMEEVLYIVHDIISDTLMFVSNDRIPLNKESYIQQLREEALTKWELRSKK